MWTERVGHAIRRREREKHSVYQGTGHSVVPLIISAAGGMMNAGLRSLIDGLCSELDPEGKNIGQQAKFVKNLIGRLSVISAHASYRLAYLSHT